MIDVEAYSRGFIKNVLRFFSEKRSRFQGKKFFTEPLFRDLRGNAIGAGSPA